MKHSIMKGALAAILALGMSPATALATVPGTAGTQSGSGTSSVPYRNSYTTDTENSDTLVSAFEASGDSTDINMYYDVTKAAGIDDGSSDYYVKVDWSAVNGSATSSGDIYYWNASTKSYMRKTINDTLSPNTAATVDITITNQSNRAVDYDISYDPETLTRSGWTYTKGNEGDSVEVTGSYTSTEAADSGCKKTGTIDSYTKNYTSVEGSSDATGQAYYQKTDAAPSAEYKGKVTLPGDSTAESGTKVGTYTVKVSKCATEVTTQNVTGTTTTGGAVTLTSSANPAQSANGTTVEFPAGALTNSDSQTAYLTVEATPILAANANSDFDISSDEGSVGAITLTAKVGGIEVTNFSSENPVTVTTYIAKGLTGVGLKYVGDTTKAQPTDVSYDSTTGKLTFKTTHFSTFSVKADQKAYIESSRTAYNTVADATNAVVEGDTVYLLKNDTLSAAQGNYGYEITKSFTLDLYGNTLTSGIRAGKDAATQRDPVNMVIKDSVDTGKFVKDAQSLHNIVLFKPGMTIYGGTFTTSDAGSVICQQIQAPGESLAATSLTINGGTFINSHRYNSTTGCGIVLSADEGQILINNGTFTGEEYSSVIFVDSGDSAADTVVNIKGGTFTGTTMFDMYSSSSTKSIVNVYGGTFNVLETEGASLVCLNNGVTKDTDAEVNIYGGTFNVDPSDYVAKGYTATKNKDNSTWTVAKSE